MFLSELLSWMFSDWTVANDFKNYDRKGIELIKEDRKSYTNDYFELTLLVE